MRANLDVIMSAPDAALWFSKLRGVTVTRHTIHGWHTRYPDLLPKRDGGYRYGDLLQAEARARRGARDTRRVA